jgi:fibronectin-binding autotransporter adhesin
MKPLASLLPLSVFLLIVGYSSTQAAAVNGTWKDTSGDNTFDTASNWSGLAVPNGSGAATFDTGGNTTAIIIGSPIPDVQGIAFGSTSESSTSGALAYTLGVSGSAGTIEFSARSATITYNGSANTAIETFNSNLVYGDSVNTPTNTSGAFTINNNSASTSAALADIVINGNISRGASQTVSGVFSITGTGSDTINGYILGTNNGGTSNWSSLAITTTSGTVTLAGDNSGAAAATNTAINLGVSNASATTGNLLIKTNTPWGFGGTDSVNNTINNYSTNSTIQIQGGHNIANGFESYSRASAASTGAADFESISGNNSIGVVTVLSDTGSNAGISGNFVNIKSDNTGDTFTINGLTDKSTSGSITAYLYGPGNGNFTGSITNSGAGSGPLGVTVAGTGTWGFSTLSSYTGGLNVTSGTAQALTAGSDFGNTASGIVTTSTGATVDLNGFSVSLGALSGTGGTVKDSGAAATLSIVGTGTGTQTYGGTIADGSGPLTLIVNNGGATQILSGTNTYTGGTTVKGVSGGTLGVLQVGNSSALGSTSAPLTISTNGELDLHGYSIQVGITAGNSSGFIVNNGSSVSTLTMAPVTGGSSNGELIEDSTDGSGGTVAVAMAGGSTSAESFSFANNYSGGTTVTGGTLKISATGGIGTGGLTVGGATASGATFALNGAGISQTVTTFNGTSNGLVDATAVGTETLTSTGGGNYAGVLANGSVAPTTDILAYQVNGGTQILSGNNTYTGGTTVTSGTLQMGSATALGSSTGSVTVNGGVLDLNGNSPTVAGTFGGTGGTVMNTATGTAILTTSGGGTYAGSLADGTPGTATLGLAVTGGTQVLNGASTYSGGTTIGGTSSAPAQITAGNAAALGASTSALAVNAFGTLDMGGNSLTVGNLTGANGGVVTNNGGAVATLTTGGTGTVNETLQDGSSKLAFAVTGGTTTLAASNTYTGGTTVTGGTLKTTAAGALGAGSLTVNGGTLNLDGVSPTGVTTFNGTSGGTVTNTTGGTQTLSTSAGGTYAGVMQDGNATFGNLLAFQVTGGAMALTGNSNSYSGGTTVSGGSLKLANTSGSATGSGGVALGAATLTGTGSASGAVAASGASGSSVITPATTTTTGDLSLGSVASTSGLTMDFAFDNTGGVNSELILTNGGLSVTGGLTFNLYDLGQDAMTPGTIYTLISGTSTLSADTIEANLIGSMYTLNTTYAGNASGILISGDTATFEINGAAAIPEPGAVNLLMGGLGLLGLYQWRRKRS